MTITNSQCMSFTTDTTGGEYKHAWGVNDGWAHHDTSTTLKGAWMEWKWTTKPSGGHNFFIPNWKPNEISILQPYITVHFWRRTA